MIAAIGFLLAVHALSGQTSGATYIEFDVPGAGTTPAEGTFPTAVNEDGTVAGHYLANGRYYAFMRATSGTITKIHISGAEYTDASSINTAGVISGTYTDTGSVSHGFVRAVDGAITIFDVRGAGIQKFEGTVVSSINSAGAIDGFDVGVGFYGFLRAPGGKSINYEPTGAVETIPLGINGSGAIAGRYLDASSVEHGFTRSTTGAISTFDAPGAGMGFNEGTSAVAINESDVIAGWYADQNLAYHAFVRAATGTITTFDAPGAGAAPGQGTLAGSINSAGDIAGSYGDASGVQHGFLRTATGTLISFDAPGADKGHGTYACALNNSGVIAGYYFDASGVAHGFLRTP